MVEKVKESVRNILPEVAGAYWERLGQASIEFNKKHARKIKKVGSDEFGIPNDDTLADEWNDVAGTVQSKIIDERDDIPKGSCLEILHEECMLQVTLNSTKKGYEFMVGYDWLSKTFFSNENKRLLV